MKDLILKCDLPVGDIVLLSAAVRDLHLSYPNQFRTAIQTQSPEIWEYNPHITSLDRIDSNAEIIDCKYSLIEKSNLAPYHCIHAFIHFFNEQLKVTIKPTVFKGAVYLADHEKTWCSQVYELTGKDRPFWIIVTGGKRDVTTKWWPVERYQEVVDHFCGKIQFVQVGAQGDHHPLLNGVIDLRDKTDLRQLVRLVYHSQGVLCPVTSLMHLAAAVDVKSDSPKNRPCVVVAGGRESSQWEAYPHHQFIHTNGSLLCCDQGGCWKSRTHPLGDGLEFDKVEHLCVDPVGNIPRCMDIISSNQVKRRIELYFQGGALDYLTPQNYASSRVEINYSEALPQKNRQQQLEPTVNNKNNVALVAVVKNEGPYLIEWIAYHLMMGVEHIYLYDDGSTDSSVKAYETMYKTGRLTVHRAIKTGRRHRTQEDCYEEWRRQYGHLYKFVMPWDGDEYLCLRENMMLQQLLDAIPQDVGQVRVNWKVFGSGNQLYADYSRFVFERFTKHSSPSFNVLTKLILRIEAMGPVNYELDQSRPICAHCSAILPEYRTVGGDLCTPVENRGNIITTCIWNGLAVCNHYAVKSFEEFVTIKKTKNVIHSKDQWLEVGSPVTNEYYQHWNQNEETDESMLKYGPPLREYIKKIDSIVLPFG